MQRILSLIRQRLLQDECKTLSSSRRKITRLALISRICLLLGMASSCALIPDFLAGDDVLTFDLRLSEKSFAFCLEDHACAHWMKEEDCSSNGNESTYQECSLQSNRGTFKVNFYKFFLTPLTRWDASRFLALAAKPTMRQLSGNDGNGSDEFIISEKAHAFFPLVPIIYRYCALGLLRILPMKILPPTFEATIVVAALIWNTICFVLAALALHGLTYQLVSTSERVSKLENGSKSDSQAPAFALKAAHVTSNLFCINPANVFFMAAYSEATFCFLTFSGHCFYATYLCERSRIQLCGAVILWTLASYARSNGSFSAIFIFISCCARIIYQWSPSMRKTIMKSVWNVLSHASIAFLIFFPVLYHDKRGYDFHCTLDDEKTPEWCENESTDFSLYGHVQRKHWNVGFLRYYELKQIPNFLLAAPILCLGTSAVVNWICNSYSNYCLTLGKCDTNSLSLLRWAIFSLGLSGGTKTNVANTKMKKVDESIITESLLGSNMLAHYAILVGFVFVGITIAHVQISTRLICSSCPAIYWYISSLVLTSDDTEDRMPRDKWIGGKFGKSQDILIVYLLGYNVLGILLHVNWLPWT